MSLPLFLALKSRTKAVVWASLLGGLAQPAGAGVAWATIRGREYEINYAAYAVLFSVTGRSCPRRLWWAAMLTRARSGHNVLGRAAAVFAGRHDTPRVPALVHLCVHRDVHHGVFERDPGGLKEGGACGSGGKRFWFAMAGIHISRGGCHGKGAWSNFGKDGGLAGNASSQDMLEQLPSETDRL